MTDIQNTTPDAHIEAADPVQPEQPSQQADAGDTELHDEPGRRDEIAEARKYRKRAQEAEGRVEALSAQLAGYHDKEVLEAAGESVDVTREFWDNFPGLSDGAPARQAERYPNSHSARLKHAEDLFSVGGLDKASVIGPDGVDRDAVAAATVELYRSRPELFTTKDPVPANPGQPEWDVTRQTSWATVIAGQADK